ncbi:MAG: hypothetical protein NTY67_15470 [Cyanobacteria bacterium]|nr:hypothetical protein [Cyanobacteriota bacterium]
MTLPAPPQPNFKAENAPVDTFLALPFPLMIDPKCREVTAFAD